MYETRRHKVFVSYHDEDRNYKDTFLSLMGDDIVDRSVSVDDIDDTNLATETIRQKIRDDFIADATVTVVLIGPCTWQRKHVDWEIGSSLRATPRNPRCGLLGLFLPNHPAFGKRQYDPQLIPPRLYDNCTGDDPYASVYYFSAQHRHDEVRNLIHQAFVRRNGNPPNNGRTQYRHNRSGRCSDGWTS